MTCGRCSIPCEEPGPMTRVFDRVFGEMAVRPHLTFLVLTKRAQRMAVWYSGEGRLLETTEEAVWSAAANAGRTVIGEHFACLIPRKTLEVIPALYYSSSFLSPEPLTSREQGSILSDSGYTVEG